MNECILSGHLASDVELRTTQSGKSVAQFRLAVKRWGKKDEADFIPIVCWDKTAESCAKYLKKGSSAIASGAIQTRTYEKDGAKRYITEVVAREVEFTGGKQDAKPQDGSKPSGGFTEIAETDDLPF